MNKMQKVGKSVGSGANAPITSLGSSLGKSESVGANSTTRDLFAQSNEMEVCPFNSKYSYKLSVYIQRVLDPHGVPTGRSSVRQAIRAGVVDRWSQRTSQKSSPNPDGNDRVLRPQQPIEPGSFLPILHRMYGKVVLEPVYRGVCVADTVQVVPLRHPRNK